MQILVTINDILCCGGDIVSVCHGRNLANECIQTDNKLKQPFLWVQRSCLGKQLFLFNSRNVMTWQISQADFGKLDQSEVTVNVFPVTYLRGQEGNKPWLPVNTNSWDATGLQRK